MASYESWNKAIASYFIAGLAKGAHVFLSLDEEAIEDIVDRGFVDGPVKGNALADFVKSVRSRCVQDFALLVQLNLVKLNLHGFRADLNGVPGGVGFLGVMVLAAYRMQEDEGIDETNYFLRFREVLRLPEDKGRPDGMPAGDEEPLWKAWNEFVSRNGFQVTAEKGDEGSQRYLHYVMSQAILRQADKDFLARKFREAHLDQQWDCNQLGGWLSRQPITRIHLREGLTHHEPARVWEFHKAAHRVYESTNWDVQPGQERGSRSTASLARKLEAGLYRSVSLAGEVVYHLFPRQPSRCRSTDLSVRSGGKTHRLKLLRPGYFAPLWPQEPFPDKAIELDVLGDPIIQKMLMPKRDFWVLTVDSDNPCGAWATWRPYLDLGEKLIILCRDGTFSAEMTRFRDAKLMEWSGEDRHDGWTEYYGCMVLSFDWGGFNVRPECRSLLDTLAPRTPAGVSLGGGLRDPNQNAWLEGFPPILRVYGFESRFRLTVDGPDGQAIDEEVVRQEDVPLPCGLPPDNYVVSVRGHGRTLATRMFRIVPWDALTATPNLEQIRNRMPASTAGLCLCGALISSERSEGGKTHG
jgi:hypothetical protein